LKRLAAVYAPDSTGGIRPLGDERVVEGSFVYTATHPFEGAKKYYSGGGGLCSTVSDYARFCQMLLNGGELDGVRLLGRKTIELMTTDQVGNLLNNSGFGLGFGIVTKLRELGSIGIYSWGGFWYTTFFIDPVEDLIAICMAQLHPDGAATLNSRFGILTYQAVVD